MTSKADAKAAIYTRLASAPTFHPANAKVFSDWTLESGDIVSMQYGEDSYNLPIYSMDMVWKGVPNVTIGNTGNKERPPLEKMAQRESARGGSAYRANRKKQDRLEFIVGLDENGEYYVDHPGKIVLAINEDHGSELLLHADTIDIDGLVDELVAYNVTVDVLTTVNTTNVGGDLIIYNGSTLHFEEGGDINGVTDLFAERGYFEELYVDDSNGTPQQAEWKSFTYRHCTLSGQHYYLYAQTSTSTIPYSSVRGRVVTEYTDTTINYLGR